MFTYKTYSTAFSISLVMISHKTNKNFIQRLDCRQSGPVTAIWYSAPIWTNFGKDV